MEIRGQRKRQAAKRKAIKRNMPSGRRHSAIASQKYYWWCWGDNNRGKRVALGGFNNESEAYERGMTAYPGTFRVYMLDTISLPAAKTKLKAIDIQEGKKIDDALKRSSNKF